MKKHFIIFALIVSCIISLPVISYAKESLINQSSISGLILDQAGEPIESALVKLDDGFNIVMTNTDENGKYMFKNLYQGLYEMEAVKEGYMSRQISGIMVNSEQNIVRNIVLQLQPILNGSISGKVANDANNPIVGAVVKVTNGPTIRSLVTDSNGNYKLSDLKPGLYEIEISQTGYVSKQFIDILLNSGEDKSNFNVMLKMQPGFLSGRVSGYTGLAIDSVTVTIIGSSNKTVTTDSNGYYRFIDLNPGNYSIEFSKTGYITSKLPNVIVSASKETANVDFVLLPISGSISGSVFNNGGIALKGAKVNIVEGPSKGSATVDEFGFYLLKDLTPGKYIVEASFAGYDNKKISEIVVESNKDSFNNNFYLTSLYGSLFGTVIQTSNSAPVSGVTVEIIGQTTKTISTSATGSYKIENLDPGVYSVRVSKTGYVSQQKFQITVEAGLNIDVAFSLDTFGTLYGYIYNKENTPINGATVEITNGFTTISANTDQRGYYSFKNLTPGNYSMKISATNYGNQEIKTINVKSNIETYLDNVNLSSVFGSISGKVKNQNTKEVISGAIIEIVGKTTKTISADSQGNYYLKDLEAGIYSVRIMKTNFTTEVINNVIINASENTYNETLLKERGSLKIELSLHIFSGYSGYLERYTGSIADYTIEIKGPMNKSYNGNTLANSYKSKYIPDEDSQGLNSHSEIEIDDLDPGIYTIIIIGKDWGTGVHNGECEVFTTQISIESGKESLLKAILELKK